MHIDTSKNKKKDEAEPTPLAHSIEKTGKLLGVSRTSVYNLISDGELQTVKLRKRRLVPATEIVRLLNPAK